MAYASAGDSSGGFGDLKARQWQQKTKQSPPSEMNKGIVAHRYFWKKKRQMENQFLNKELEKKTCEQTLLSEKQLRKRAPEEQTSKALSCKNMSYKMDELQRLCIAKKLACKSVELQKYWVARATHCFQEKMKSFSFHWVLQFWIVLTYLW